MSTKLKKTDAGKAHKFLDKRGVLIFLGVAIVALSLVTFSVRFLFVSGGSLEALPHLNFAGMEKPVIEKIIRVQEELKKDPNSSKLWGKLAVNLYIHEIIDESVPLFEQAARLDPDEFRWPYYCAIARTKLGAQTALDWFERSRKLRQDYAPLYVRLAQAHFMFGNFKQARVAFNRAITIDPNQVEAYLGLAQISMQKNATEDAKEYLTKAIKIKPNYKEAHSLLANVYRKLQDLSSAKRELLISKNLYGKTSLDDPIGAEMISEGVSSFWCRYRGVNYLSHRLYRKALDEFRKALQARPDAADADNMGIVLQYSRRYKEAEEFHRAAIALDSMYVKAYNNLGFVLYKQGKLQDAIFFVQKAIRIKPEFSDAYLSLGKFLRDLGRRKEAIEAFRKGREYAPQNMHFAFILAWLLATAPEDELRNGREAVQLATLVCEDSNYRIPSTLDLLAAAYAENRQFDKAFETARKAYQLASSSGKTNFAQQIKSRLELYRLKQPYRERSNRGEKEIRISKP